MKSKEFLKIMKEKYGMNKTEISKKYDIPYGTIEKWGRVTEAPEYLLNLILKAEENEYKHNIQ